jgi:putative heme-binding domain-containing protein
MRRWCLGLVCLLLLIDLLWMYSIWPGAASVPMPRVPDGFQVELILQTPDVEAPTALCVAPNGDVYYAEDPMDMGGPATENRDRVWQLKGGDPARKVLVADGLGPVMGLEVVRDKLYVVHAPHLSVFKLDTEGRPEGVEELFSDLGPPQPAAYGMNDHAPSGIRMGMDGRLYVSIGDKGIPRMGRKERDRGSVDVFEGRERRTREGHHVSLEGGGVIRFRPDGSGLEVFASGTRNHFDLAIDDQDRVFVRDNTDDGEGWDARLMYLIEGGYYGYPWAFKREPRTVLPPVSDFGSGAPTGGWAYADDGLPATYRDCVFHCDWLRRKVLAARVTADGAAFRCNGEIEFMGTDGTGVEDFRPVALRPTADGRGFYVTDWGYSGWLKPVKAGRIWKVTYVGGDTSPTPRGRDTDPVARLVEALDHPAHTERLRAQRALSVRGDEAIAALKELLWRGATSPRAKRHALWALRELTASDSLPFALKLALDEDVTVRLQAVRVLATYSQEPPDTSNTSEIAEVLLGSLKGDSDPQVRLHAAIALASLGNLDIGRELLLRLEHEQDLWVRYALVRGLKRTAPWSSADRLLEGVQVGRRPAVRDGLFLALSDEYDLNAVGLLGRLISDPDTAVRRKAAEALGRVHHDRAPYAGTWWSGHPERNGPPSRNVAWEGTPLARNALLHALADGNPEVRQAAAAAVVGLNDSDTLDALVGRARSEPVEATRALVFKAILAVRSPEAIRFFHAVLSDDGYPEPLRLLAVEGLEGDGDRTAAGVLVKAAVGGPTALRVRALQALGRIGAPAARASCESCLKATQPQVRAAAVDALAGLGGPELTGAILERLRDEDVMVRLAAVRFLGKHGAREVIPALLEAWRDPGTRSEATAALARLPDRRALWAYLEGLQSSNTELCVACGRAIGAIREELLPDLERLAGWGELQPEQLKQLRDLYDSFAPVLDWRLAGPLPAGGDSNPPPAEGGQGTAWRTRRADSLDDGKVNLPTQPGRAGRSVIYLAAEVGSKSDRDAELQLGNNIPVVVRLNGTTVYSHSGVRDRTNDTECVNVRLKKGANSVLVRCDLVGEAGGTFSLAVSPEISRYEFLGRESRRIDPEAFRAFSRRQQGDPVRGRRLFADPRGPACDRCHSVGGNGGKVGPDLATIGLKYDREGLMTAVLQPSETIARGYESVVITTTDGLVLTGSFGGEDAGTVTVVDPEGRRRRIAKTDIESRALSPVSLMPSGLAEGFTPQDFSDLIAFLASCRGGATGGR